MTILVDFHNHLLQVPGNQYSNEEETLRILRAAAEEGITHIVAAPPYRHDQYTTNGSVIEHLVRKLNDKLSRFQIPIIVLPGMEIILYEKLASDMKVHAIPLANSNKYVFIRFQNHRIPSFAQTVFFELQLMGYIPIIANAEKIKEIRLNYSTLNEFVDKGALVHIGAASILGLNGSKKRKVALKLCKAGLVQFVSSSGGKLDKNPPHLKKAYRYLEKKLSINEVEKLKGNAASIISGVDFHSRNSLMYKVK